MFVSLHGLNEERQQGLEAFAADPVRRFPDHNQRIADRVIIKSARWSLGVPRGLFTTQHPHCMLAITNSSKMRVFSLRSLLAYRSRTATASSSRVAIVTRLMPASAPGYRPEANQMRQHVSIREHF